MDDIAGIVKGIVLFAVVIAVLGSIVAIGIALWPVWLVLRGCHHRRQDLLEAP